jgi:NADH-quinone oxidoreductase subunit H
MFSFSSLTGWIDEALRGFLPDGWVLFVEFLLIGVVLLASYALLALFLI